MPELEICCYSDTSVKIAAKAGASRAELCGAGAGGTTPDEATMLRSRSIPDIKLHILIRPRTGNFCYSETEFEAMKDSILFARQLGADGVVFGILNANGTVDINRNRELAALAAPMDTTFHKAFDECKDLFRALDDISDCGMQRILTSGGHPTALAGIDTIAQLIAYAKGKIIIMAGGGIRSDVIHRFQIPGLHEFHSSAILSGDTADEKEIQMLASSLYDFKKP